MLYPVRLIFALTAGSIAAYFALSLVLRLFVGLIGLVLSVLLPLIVVVALAYVVVRTVSPNALRLLRRLGR